MALIRCLAAALVCFTLVATGFGLPGQPNSARWMELMSDVLFNQTLPDMTLPGCHDSGTYHLENSIDEAEGALPDWLVSIIDFLKKEGFDEPFELIRPWAQTQRYRLYDQLLRGIRFFDIRITWDGKTFRTEHFLLGQHSEVMLNDIAEFMKQNQKEVLIVEFGAFDGFNQTLHEAAQDLIVSILGPYLWPRAKGFGTYGQMVTTGQRILAFYDSSQYVLNPGFWDGNMLVSDWADVDNFPQMVRYELISVRDSTGDPAAIYKLQWVLTASERRVVDGLFEPFALYRSLYDLSKSANSNLDKFLANTSQYRINILMSDFPEETDMVERARMMNLMNCNDNPLYRKRSDSGSCIDWIATCATNATVAALCPMTCGLCKEPVGQAGSSCKSNSDCMYNNCNLMTGICLNDYPAVNGEPCGANFQCASGKCLGNRCVGYPIGAKCIYNETCGSGVCAQSRCAGTPGFIWLGSAPFCAVSPLSCESDPRGLVFVANGTCGDGDSCVNSTKVLCSNALLPYSTFYWLGSAPFCSSSPSNCGASNYILSNSCGDGDYCVTGEKVLCAK